MDTKMRTMELNDFLNMCEQDLLGFWIKDQCENIEHPDFEDFAACVYSFQTYGRSGVADILAERQYQTEAEPVRVIGLPKAKELLTKMKNNNDFTIFSIDFIKRSTGELRHMVCRFGVTTKLKGGEKAFDDKDHDLKTVYDMGKAGYRSVSQEGIIRMKIHGRVYMIEENIALADKLTDE